MEFFNCTQNTRRTLKSIIDRLEELNLITSAEKEVIDRPWHTKAEMKAGIYDILCKKEYITGTQILKIIKEFDGNEKNTEDAANRNELVTQFQERQINVDRKNRLQCLPVEMVHCLFGFLSVGDIKNCRLVSSDWNSVVREVLMNRTSIRIGPNYSNRLLADFYSCFSIPDAQLTAFDIWRLHRSREEEGKWIDRDKPWSILQLTGFFEDQQKFMKTLNLHGIYLVKDDIENKEIIKEFDVSPWIANSLFTKPNHQCLTKLSIDSGFGFRITTLIIPLQIIAQVKELHLANCIVALVSGVQICPVKLRFSYNTFRNNGIDLPKIIINDIVNLSNTKELILHCNGSDNKGEITLDLSGSFSLQKLYLEGVKTLNWATSKWTVQNMDLAGVEFILKTEMTIADLYFDWLLNTIDIFAIPQSIERLTINTQLDDETAVCSQQILLNCLKYLEVEAGLWLNIFLPFVNFPQLAQLYLNKNYTEFEEINSSLIPKTVRVLKLYQISIKCEEHDLLNLEKLILENIKYNLVRKLFIAKNLFNDLVWEIHWDYRSESDFFDFSWEFQQLCFFGEKRLYVGRFEWSNEVPFQESPLYDRVDEESSYYVFENRKGIKGRAISLEEFKEKTRILNSVFS